MLPRYNITVIVLLNRFLYKAAIATYNTDYYFSQGLFAVLPHELGHLLSVQQHGPHHKLMEWVAKYIGCLLRLSEILQYIRLLENASNTQHTIP